MCILSSDITKLGDHFKCITLLSDEKGKQFTNAQKLKYFYSKKNTPINRLKDLRESLHNGEADSIKKLSIYKESIRNIVNKERKEQESNYNVVDLLSKYIDFLEQTKDGSNKRFLKISKNVRSTKGNYREDLPLVEFWDFLVRKYETMMKNNSLYIVFISNVKVKIGSTVISFTNSTKA